jgi:tetratricopeptide (TPR) repeat protein
MTSRRKNKSLPNKNAPSRRVHASGPKLWLMRLAMMIVAPVTFLVLLEVALRLAGFGHATSFLLPSSNNGQKTFVQNNKFGWRFFGSRMARLPHPISIPQEKSPGTVRIFVFGESAAYGDPQPRFGLSRMLQVMLTLRHSGTRFEVINTAMTGINSHVILPIARDCARASGDIWVIYMGNNEVVGPFGAGTVFGPQAPPASLVRASLALKATRIGQLLDSGRQWFQKAPADKSEWGGMLMFLNQQVRADEARMTNVYRNFEKNLTDIIRAGHDSGAGVVVSTVAVNLESCAPFASQHRPNLSESDKTKWEQFYKLGIEAWQARKFQEADAFFRKAAALDDTVAELHFRLGQCAVARGELREVRFQFPRARDLDTLRFRCDTRLNELIWKTVSNREHQRILLADAVTAFTLGQLPDEELFYEHVHLTFAGNYLLARTIGEQVEKLLPKNIPASDKPWPTIAECASHLAYTDRDLLNALSDILARLNDPPFTGQMNHDEQVRHLTQLAQKCSAANSQGAISNALALCASAVEAMPDDALLLEHLASLKQSVGDLAGAESAEKRSLELLPSTQEGWSKLGFIYVQEQRFEDAAAAFRRAFEEDAQDVWVLQDLAHSLVKLNRHDEALAVYRKAVEIKPRFGPGWLDLGQLLETMNRKAEADDCFQKALTNRIYRVKELTVLARFCQSRGWFEAASTNYADAIKLNPSDATLRFEAGQSLGALGRHNDAAQRYAEAAQLSPGWWQAHFRCGLELGRADKPAEATSEFREAVRIMPDVAEIRLNLGIALVKQGQNAEALKEFEWMIQRFPTNTLALQYIEALRKKAGP